MIKTVEKPWGKEQIFALTDKYCGKIITIKAGQRLSKQYHEKKEETIYVIFGILKVYHEGKEHLLSAGQSFHVKPGEVHRFEAAGDFSCKIIEVSTPELDDVVRVEDDYER